ncbi:hypothetical protein C723_3228 [Christiangramia flava JLT2011]|uniref:Uncharacterized protein n=1 Tax=Christiangramia flava JLT2011 TaxID=1229726 RepID=A0A1L7I788_9FLAO|nr:hypothetical protein GRFL_2726 [Christiangramia flava JLT2011]OSS37949.1 hypothetical protein C723_3228 [Christiangramia flava JLT2011]
MLKTKLFTGFTASSEGISEEIVRIFPRLGFQNRAILRFILKLYRKTL